MNSPSNEVAAPALLFSDLVEASVRRLQTKDSVDAFSAWFAEAALDHFPDLPRDTPLEQDVARRGLMAMARKLWSAVPLPELNWKAKPLVRPERNTPCYCGSGEKYKQCCVVYESIEAPVAPEQGVALVLATLDDAALANVDLRHAPLPALETVAQDWFDEGRFALLIAKFSPFFEQVDRLGERHTALFEWLVDALLALGRERDGDALVRKVVSCRDRELSTAARCRLVGMLGVRGDFDAAWAMLRECVRRNPDAPEPMYSELTLLLAEGRNDEAGKRAPALAERARALGYENLAQRLALLGTDGLAGVRRLDAAFDAELEELPSRVAQVKQWIALCELIPPSPAEAVQRHYRVSLQQEGDAASGVAALFSIDGSEEILQLGVAFNADLNGGSALSERDDSGTFLSNLDGVAGLLRANPDRWFALNVLNGLLEVAYDLEPEASSAPTASAITRLADFAFEVLQALLPQPSARVGDGPHGWVFGEMLANCFELYDLLGLEPKATAVARWGIARIGEDENDWTDYLIGEAFHRQAWDEALALAESELADRPSQSFSRALALKLLGDSNAAAEAMADAHLQNPHVAAMLLAPIVDRPPGFRFNEDPAEGSLFEAFAYCRDFRSFWAQAKVLDWVASLNLETPTPGSARVRPSFRRN